MTAISQHELAGLVERDRVHRRVYTDPAVFGLERERIFRRAWLYVGHESQVPRPGDFVASRLDGDPVQLTRPKDGRLHVLRIRCDHRGAKVCLHESGSVARFQCPYHGWTYDTDGALLGGPSKPLFPRTSPPPASCRRRAWPSIAASSSPARRRPAPASRIGSAA
jgi:phenylpropionate dioxygenase-like ring-hydroxylating dioxygenase large terminal subunit